MVINPANNLFSLSQLKSNRDLPTIYAVTSGKGGVGKSTISLNIAILLAQLKKNILLIDADVHLGNLDLLLGLRPEYTIADVIMGKQDLKDIIIPGPGGVDILPASSASMDVLSIEEEVLTRLGTAFSQFEHEYDAVLVDTAAGITKDVMSFVHGADKVILVVTPDPASIADAYGMIKLVKRGNIFMPVMMIANMVRNEEEGESLFKKMNLMVQRFLESNIYYGGALLHDPQVGESIRRQRSIVLDSPICKTVNILKLITRNLLKLPEQDAADRVGLFERFKQYRDLTIGEES